MDLKTLNILIDELLKTETPETLIKWLNEKRDIKAVKSNKQKTSNKGIKSICGTTDIGPWCINCGNDKNKCKLYLSVNKELKNYEFN